MELSNLAGLSKPASKLIEAVSRATGVLYEPTRIRREARAQADALLLKTSADIQADELLRRAADRFVAQEIKKQENIEAVLDKSLELVSKPIEDASEIDADWMSRFILEAQEVSDERLQTVWAKLLAGEFSSPGSFPRRLFRVIKDLEPNEAAVDEIAAKILWVEGPDGSVTAFLSSHIRQEWQLGQESELDELAEDPVAEIGLLRELGLVEAGDFTFRFSVEGPLDPAGIHLDGYSARRIFAGDEVIAPEHIQPHFVRTKGPAVTANGVPQINQWSKVITFDAWRVTALGASMFSLARKDPDPAHMDKIRGVLLGAGMLLIDPPRK